MIPSDFYKVIKDFIADLILVFPELVTTLDPALQAIADAPTDPRDAELEAHYSTAFTHIVGSMPANFFEILGENETLFEKPCVFLPGIDFSALWSLDTTPKTKETIWKYLKLILLVVASSVDGSAFGESAKTFDFMNDTELKKKIDEATADIHSFFSNPDAPLPDAEEVHEHLKGMMGGKLGALAKEIAEETVGDASPESLQGMMKDPSKMFGLVHKVGDKIDKKIKSGELKESELLQEATEMLEKMKGMPGMGGLDAMFKKFAGGKVDLSGMQAKMGQNMKQAKTKERLQKKLADKKLQVEPKFTAGEPAERTPKKKKKGKK